MNRWETVMASYSVCGESECCILLGGGFRGVPLDFLLLLYSTLLLLLYSTLLLLYLLLLYYYYSTFYFEIHTKKSLQPLKTRIDNFFHHGSVHRQKMWIFCLTLTEKMEMFRSDAHCRCRDNILI